MAAHGMNTAFVSIMPDLDTFFNGVNQVRFDLAPLNAFLTTAQQSGFGPVAYNTTVEVAIYCAGEATGRGLGTMLYKALFEALAEEDVRMAMAGITLPNPASVALHEHFGFTLVGVMHEVGRKFDRYWDVAWYEKRLE